MLWVVEVLGFEDVGDVAAGEDDDGMGVFADLDVGRASRWEVVTRTPNWRWHKPGDQAAGFADADAVAGCVAFGFQREPDGDRVAVRGEEVVAGRVASAVAPGPGDVDLADVGLAGPPMVGGELLEAGWPVFEVLVVLSVNVTPVGSWPVLVIVGAGEPVVVTVKVAATPNAVGP